MIQWSGTSTSGGTNAATGLTATFPISFESKACTMVANARSAGDIINVSGINSSGFTYHIMDRLNTGNYNNSYWYIVIGC